MTWQRRVLPHCWTFRMTITYHRIAAGISAPTLQDLSGITSVRYVRRL